MLVLGVIAIKKRNDEWEREPEIDARIEILRSVENDISIHQRRQYRHGEQTSSVIADAAYNEGKQTYDIKIRTRRPARTQNGHKDNRIEHQKRTVKIG